MNDIISNCNKADIAFYRGYTKFRLSYRIQIFLHILQAIGLLAFIPIDQSLLVVGDKALTAEIVGLLASIILISLNVCKYYFMFLQQGLQRYCLMARSMGHATNQPITSANSLQSCTSEVVVDAEADLMAAVAQQEQIEACSRMIRNQLYLHYVQKYRYLKRLQKLEVNIGFAGMVTIIVLMAKSQYLNKVEIAVLAIYIVLQLISKLTIISCMLLVIISPILCIIYACYNCCCKREDELDLQVVEAKKKDVIKCGVSCKICLQDIGMGDNIYNTLPCSQKHIFHSKCLDRWVKIRGTCRCCGTKLPFKNTQKHAQVNEIQPQTP